MSELSRYGHRQRMRDLYLSGGMEYAPDHNLLELFLSLVIPQKDVKPIAYDLMNTFGSLENILNAVPEDLMSVKGVGESTAVAISLIKTINKRVSVNKNKSKPVLINATAAKEYCKNILCEETNEKFVVITLTNNGTVIHPHIIDGGGVNRIHIEIKDILRFIINDNAAGVIISHNHPEGKSEPSAADIYFTIEFRAVMRKTNINFIDHVIVGKDDCTSFRQNPEYFYIDDDTEKKK